MLIQRLGSDTQKKDEFIDGLINEIIGHPGCCDEVWLASEYGFPKIEVHKKSVEKLMQIAEKFRNIGVRVSLQISNTIGHGEYMSGTDCSGLVYEGSPVENMVGPDGVSAKYCFCWNGEHFRNYVIEEVREYAKIIPHCVWIDDDLRATNHSPVEYGCFCNNCITKFNQKYDANFSRESLVNEINYGDISWREKYIEFVRESIGDFTYNISKAVHDVSSDSYMGFQYCAHGSYTGYGYEFIFDAMRRATGKSPKSRPGGGAYSDHNPNAFIDKAKLINWQNYMLPDYVCDMCPEIENLPDVVYGKSIAGTCFETTLYFANGNTSMSYAMLMNDYEPMSWHGQMLEQFAKHRPYWQKLIEYNKTSYQAGLRLCLSKNMWKQKLNDDDEPFAWSKEPYMKGTELLGTAIPIAYCGNENSVYLLHYENAKRLSRKEIDFLLDKPVLTDGASLALIAEKGARFSAKAEEISTAQLYELYTKHEINKGFEGRTWSQGFYYKNGHHLIDINGETEIFGVYDTNAKNVNPMSSKYPYGIANAVVKTEKGAKWAVFGHMPWTRTISSQKRNQILNAADYISGNRIPAILSTPQQAILLPRENKEGKVTNVSIVNCTIGGSGNLTLKIRRPASNKFVFISRNIAETELVYSVYDDEYIVSVPNIEPWSIGTVFCI